MPAMESLIILNTQNCKVIIMKRLLYIGLLLFLLACEDYGAGPYLGVPKPPEADPEEEVMYRNPVFEPILADPTVVRDPRTGLFYAYGTEDNWGDGVGNRVVPIVSSENLTSWTLVGQAFSTKPNWKNSGNIWAPDVVYMDGKFVMYYSYSTWGDANPGVGVATAEQPAGPFTDQGKLFTSNEINVPNSIDPHFFEEGGHRYLFWGSFSNAATQGTYVVDLSDDGLSVPDLSQKTKIAAGDFEAVMIHKREDYYYFFGSKGSCCEGANSQYRVLVARSTNLKGPYLDRDGHDISERGRGTILLQGSEIFAGPGHNSRIMTDDEGTDWLLYHGIDRAQGTVSSGATRRPLMLDKIEWRDGWPSIGGAIPSAMRTKAPVFN